MNAPVTRTEIGRERLTRKLDSARARLARARREVERLETLGGEAELDAAREERRQAETDVNWAFFELVKRGLVNG